MFVSRISVGSRLSSLISPLSLFPRSFSSSSVSTGAITLESHKHGVYSLVFNRPEALNSMTVALGEQFSSAIEALSSEASKDSENVYHRFQSSMDHHRTHMQHKKELKIGSILALQHKSEYIHKFQSFIGNNSRPRVLVLSGAGRAFSAGGDLDFLLARCNDTKENNVTVMLGFYKLFSSILNIPIPTIAAVHGSAIGAGACVSLFADQRIATNKAEIGFTFSRLGLHPGMGCTHTLPLIVGQSYTNYLLQSGDVINADKAYELGLVHQVVKTSAPGSERDELMKVALDKAYELSQLPCTGITSLTATLRSQMIDHLDHALDREAHGQSLCYASPDLKARVEKMKNKSKK